MNTYIEKTTLVFIYICIEYMTIKNTIESDFLQCRCYALKLA